MTGKKYNVGIIGYGAVSTTHIAAINATPLAQVTALYSSRSLDQSQINDRHGGGIICYDHLDALLSNKSINVVSICTYPQDHARYAIAAAKAGKHIILEKPIALNWPDCLEVQKAVQTAKVKTCICFEARFSSQFQTIKAVIDRGWLGKIHYAEVDYYHGIGPGQPQYRWNVRKDSGGSSLLTAGCHALDALLLCMGEDVEVVSSYSTHSHNRDFAKYEYPTTSVTILKFKDGRVGKVASVIDCLQPSQFHVHLVGSDGTLVDNKFYSTTLGGLCRSEWSELAFKPLVPCNAGMAPYQAQFEAFFTSLDAGCEMPLTSLSHALRTHEVIFAADSSAERHAHRKH